MAKKKTTNDFDRKKTRELIEGFLKKRNGELLEEWAIPIGEMVDCLELKAMCMAHIRENGLIDKNTGKKNEFLSSVASLESNIYKLLVELGCGVKSSKRVKELSRRAGKTQDADLLSALIGTDDEDE